MSRKIHLWVIITAISGFAMVLFMATTSRPVGKANNWKVWAQKGAGIEGARSEMANQPGSKTQRFSAVRLLEDQFQSREKGNDFLTLYMKRSLPKDVNAEDARLLENQILAMQNLPSVPKTHYRRGIYYFFLAVVETKLMAMRSFAGDYRQVEDHWRAALSEFTRANELGVWMREDLQMVISSADQDGNGSLEEPELVSIILQRS